MSSDASRLILFDIDQTLIFTAGAGMRSMARAVLEVTGIDLVPLNVHPGGKTDPGILEEVLLLGGFDVAGQAVMAHAHGADGAVAALTDVHEEVWERYARFLGEEMAREDARRHIKPGIPALLDALAADPRACLGLLTGNLERTGRLKLAAFDLNKYFPIGAYGSDSADRNDLGHVAMERARKHFARAFTSRDTWIVGDTDRDVGAARACGAHVLAVATGHMSMAELEALEPDVVMADLSDVARVVEVLLG